MPLQVPAAATASGRPRPRVPRPVGAVLPWVPALLLAAFIALLLHHDGVRVGSMLRYAAYWVIAVILPGLVVSRTLLRVRATIVEDLSVGAVTGISLEILSWVVGVTTGLGDIVRFWFLPVLVLGVAVPAARRRVFVRIPERVPLPHSLALVGITGYLVAGLSAGSLTYQAALPPKGGNTYLDMWWQLSLVQELMKYEPPQIPQLAGEPFHYHYFANVQIASGVRLSGVAPEVVTFRLWYIPILLLSVGTAVVLGRALTRSLTAGVVTAGVVYVLATTSYLWLSALGSMAPTPLAFTSPSQLLANIALTTCAYGAVLLLRGRGRGGTRGRSWWLLVIWVVLIVVGASGDKSTIVPLLLAGTVAALGRALVTRSWRTARWLGLATVAVLALQAVITSLAAETAGGKVTILGPLHFLPAFADLVPTTELRAMNHGLLLDSITSPRTAGYALLATVVVLGFHTMRLVGVAGLARRSVRDRDVHWWLAGATLAGYAAMLSIDHVGGSQSFFGTGGGLLGAALTVSVLWDALGRLGAARWAVLGWGLLAGCVVTLLVEYVTEQAAPLTPLGTLDRILIPMAVVAAAAAIGCLAWRRARGRWTRDALWVVVLAALIGVAVPSNAVSVATTAIRLIKPLPAAPASVTTAEQRAALWLRRHSDPDDVVATNAYCKGVVTTRYCSARGFWVSGLAGRRVVLEGWGYTDQALAVQGRGGRTYDRQDAPFPERSALNQDVFRRSDQAALAQLRKQYGVRWLFAVHRAGPTPSFPDSVARIRFDNGAVTIFEVR